MLARAWPGTTPDYWLTADPALTDAAVSILIEETEETEHDD